MAHVNTKNEERDCPFTRQSIEQAYGPEVTLILHCHLRGYDRHGEGKCPDLEYYDKYGAPVEKDNSWEEGYHVIEQRLADHYNAVVDNKLPFPVAAGVGGGVHLYKSLHDDDQEPWNWTGWVPLQRRWLSQGTFFCNRYFLALRGNEIQNNLWDYDPHDTDKDPHDLIYSQLEPNDRYRGGYWYSSHPFGRYLHIIALKSHVKDTETNTCKRYNYIVHPLAYRAAIDTLPDNSVDAMQWCIVNIPDEKHFGEGKSWGEKCHGLEIFNDFTYYYSYQPIEKDGPNNSELARDPSNNINGDNRYHYWYDTYPMEFAVFLLDSALARGVYLHTMCANDAFYQKTEEQHDEQQEILLADPKDHLLRYNLKCRGASQEQKNPRLGVFKADPSSSLISPTVSPSVSPTQLFDEEDFPAQLQKIGFLEGRPYGVRTALGYVTLIDPRLKMKNEVFKVKAGLSHMGLEDGEIMALEYLREGKYYATTGLHNLFQYELSSIIPYRIGNQKDIEQLCYDLTEEMLLEFTFLKCTEEMAYLIWRYTMMIETPGNKLLTCHGYFKLDDKNMTTLDLTKMCKPSQVKWIYFTVISPRNPQRRAWFHAIRGPAFGKPQYKAKIAEQRHCVLQTSRNNNNTITPGSVINPTPVRFRKGCDLDFALGTALIKNNEPDIFVYFMQVCPLQQDLTAEPVKKEIKESSDIIPPRFLQSVHGYFYCGEDHPTRLNLDASWDKNTVKDNTVYFYRIDGKTGDPCPMEKGNEPKLFRAPSRGLLTKIEPRRRRQRPVDDENI